MDSYYCSLRRHFLQKPCIFYIYLKFSIGIQIYVLIPEIRLMHIFETRLALCKPNKFWSFFSHFLKNYVKVVIETLQELHYFSSENILHLHIH